MKRNCEFIDLGEFEMTSPVMRVSDPCYERDVWCCGTVDHCKLGTWEAGVLKTDEGEWGTRCAVLAVRHKDTGPDFNVIRLGKVRKVACKCVEQSFEVGVDSGQAGFFDDAFYQNDTVFEELPAPGFAIGDLWYLVMAVRLYFFIREQQFRPIDRGKYDELVGIQAVLQKPA